jgi:nucleolar protein 53
LNEQETDIIDSGIVAEKTSDELFTTDTTGSLQIKKTYAKSHKPLKADKILAQRSALPAVDNRKRSALSNVTNGIVEPSSKRHKKNGVHPKELERLRKIAYGGETVHRDVVSADIDADYDPWAPAVVEAKPEFSFLEDKVEAKVPKTLKRAPISMAKSGREIPAIAKPISGKSYNPTLADWEAVVDHETNIAVDLERKRLEDVRHEEELQERIAKAQAEEERQNESAWESEWESEWEGIVSEHEGETTLNKKRPTRKTQAERNKIKRRKEEERKRMWESKQRKREQQVRETKALLKAFHAKEKARAERNAIESDADDSSDDGKAVELRRRRLGKGVVPDAPLEVVLPDELTDSLRLLKPEGNLLKDRFRSMMIRGKVETRAPIWQHKQAKKTVTEKWAYKDWKLK